MEQEERKETTQPETKGKRPESPNQKQTEKQNNRHKPGPTHIRETLQALQNTQKREKKKEKRGGGEVTTTKTNTTKVKQPWGNKKTKTEKREKEL